jgi:hypothetical protein
MAAAIKTAAMYGETSFFQRVRFSDLPGNHAPHTSHQGAVQLVSVWHSGQRFDLFTLVGDYCAERAPRRKSFE